MHKTDGEITCANVIQTLQDKIHDNHISEKKNPKSYGNIWASEAPSPYLKHSTSNCRNGYVNEKKV